MKCKKGSVEHDTLYVLDVDYVLRSNSREVV